MEGTKPIEPYLGKPDYILDVDLADHAIDWIRKQKASAPQRPFLAYYATGTAHAPHHAPKEWIAKFKGKFDQGWDKVREETLARQKQLGVVPPDTQLTARSNELPAWDSLSADQKRLYARMAEVYAGALAHADHNIGRVIDAIRDLGELDNTLIIYIMGDNGCSGEGTVQGTTNELAVNANGVVEDLPYLLSMIDKLGGPETYNHMPAAWAHAFDTPFQWTKQVASHFGGTRNGLVISWPKRIKDAGGIRTQFHHVIDIVPTIYEAVGVKAPDVLNGVKQVPIEGVSMAYTFDTANANAASARKTQYFEMLGNRGIYSDGTPLRLPWTMAIGAEPNPDDYKWELCKQVAQGRIERTIQARFSLDETFDVGADTGTAVIEDYADKMPFRFTGTLSKLVINLGANELTPQKRGELERLQKDFALRMQ